MGSRSRGHESKGRSTRRRVTGRDRIGPSSSSVEQPGALGNRATMEALGVTQGSAPFSIQRKCKECEEEEKTSGSGSIQRAAKPGAPDVPSDEKTPAAAGAGAKHATAKAPPRTGVADSDGGALTPDTAGKDARAAAGTGAASALIANDDARSVAPEQMRKSEFLSVVRAGMAGLEPGAGGAGGGQASRWLDYFEASDASTLEDAIHRFVPETSRARTAHDYLRMLAAKARNEAGGTATGGKSAGKPSATGLGTTGRAMPGLSLKEGGGAASGGGSAGTARAGGSHAGGDVGGGHAGASPAAVSRQLGPGTPLHSSVRASMETAFGISFARVRLHTDRRAAELSDSLHARAFTVGEHVAFGPGEYRPDSAIGQALIAHELAHVVQQSGAARDTSVQPGTQTEGALEREADATAVQAVLAGQQGTRRGLADVRMQAMPRLKSSLRLSRCNCGRKDPKPSPTPEIPATEEAVGKFIGVCINLTTKNRTKNSGLWYAIEYKYAFPNDWDSDYDSGLADDFYWDREKPMHWRVKEGRSASNAVKQWFKGLTIAECFSTAIAVQVNTIRAVLGDARFDELYGSQDVKMPKSQRLEMGVEGATPLTQLQQSINLDTRGQGVGVMGKRPAKVGEWYYFRNHPMYLLKHPAGIFQGENAFLLEDPPSGDQVWGGFGLAKVTERAMLGAMANDYNQKRTREDRETLDYIKEKNGGKLPKEYEPGFFPDRITVNMIPGTVYDYKNPWDGKTHHFVGGFDPRSGQTFSLEKVKKLLGPPQTTGSPAGGGTTSGSTTSGE
jgi:hypothetical protein